MTVTTKRVLQSATFLACFATAVALHAGTTLTTAWGGGGGTSFSLDCKDDAILVGFQVWGGSWVDGVRPMCVKLTQAGKWSGNPYRGQGPTGRTVGNFAEKLCNRDETVVSIHGRSGSFIHRIDLKCLPLGNTAGSGRTLTFAGSQPGSVTFGWYTCSNSKPARGFHGKSGLYIDSIGLRCHSGSTPLLSN